MMRSSIALALALFAVASLPAAADVLYKSMDANGIVSFSDTPPPEGARILEERLINSPDSPTSPSTTAPTGGLEEAFQMIDYDATLAQANARVDMAERALALARGGGASRTEGLRLPNMTQVANNTNSDHVEFRKSDLKLARHALMDLLRSRQLASGRQPKG